MAKRYEGQAQFFVIYIKEAHPSDGWASRVNPKLTYIQDPTSFYERSQVASTCIGDLDIDIPCLVDDMDNSAAKAYKGWPDRLFVIAKDGSVAYVGLPGPFGFLPSEMETALQEELAKH